MNASSATYWFSDLICHTLVFSFIKQDDNNAYPLHRVIVRINEIIHVWQVLSIERFDKH